MTTRQTPGEIVALNMRRHRQRLGISQRELRDRMRRAGGPYCQSTISAWENGTRAVMVDALAPLAAALDTTPPALLSLPVDPVRLCCGRRQSEHDTTGICPTGTVMCCHCFGTFAPAQLATNGDGDTVDVCRRCHADEAVLTASRAAR